MVQIDTYFKAMQGQGASDLHMVIGRPPMIRKGGQLAPMTEFPVLTADSNRQILFELLSEEEQQRLTSHRDFDKAYELAGVARFRCNFFYQMRGVGAVFRIIPTKILTLDQLGMPQVLRRMTTLRSGLVLVTGPTGSGKSTTLAAMIDHINETRDGHIITIEDPLEFVHPNKNCIFSQREVGAHTHSFGDALRVASREDPNVILVGEMRDLETISLGLTCAELGILVFGTLHTNSASKTIDRIINAFPSNQQEQTRIMLSESLKGVVAQQLLPTADGKGRCAAVEVLFGSSALASMIRDGKIAQINSYIQTGTSEGMQTMDQHLMQLVKAGRVTAKAAYEKAQNKTLFVDMLAEAPLTA